ncbi:alpha/beta family hydrolase [Phytohalomonas tamaricis]|uniref:alpha/beta family hydrolase n=1 Tax=Phytohalomonas tamaricis TaxID=2081032 RepID=UPI0021D42796|nr:alpha/beta family hydrolase [Phytohalomonas tamaricis]
MPLVASTLSSQTFASLIDSSSHDEGGQASLALYDVEALGRVYVCGSPLRGRLLLAHGAGAGPESAFIQGLLKAIASEGVQTLAIEFAYWARARHEGRRRPPPKIATLCDEIRAWRNVLPSSVWLGGKSMGGRAASMVAAEEGAPGLALCGYPFHPPGKPDRLRLDHWPQLTCPTLVLQGTRDPFGRRDEIEDYKLPTCVRVHFLEDGDHDFKPRRSSGRSQHDLICEAAGQIRHIFESSSNSSKR